MAVEEFDSLALVIVRNVIQIFCCLLREILLSLIAVFEDNLLALFFASRFWGMTLD